jgi:death-on-curing protein
MTVENESSQIKYLSTADIEEIYTTLSARFAEIGEPIPSFRLVKQGHIENLVALPQTSFFDAVQYPSLESKATIIFYKINKGHIFPNGNKRMSIACLLVFLSINNMVLRITSDELTAKALWLAESPAEEFERVKQDIEKWIRLNLKEK